MKRDGAQKMSQHPLIQSHLKEAKDVELLVCHGRLQVAWCQGVCHRLQRSFGVQHNAKRYS